MVLVVIYMMIAQPYTHTKPVQYFFFFTVCIILNWHEQDGKCWLLSWICTCWGSAFWVLCSWFSPSLCLLFWALMKSCWMSSKTEFYQTGRFYLHVLLPCTLDTMRSSWRSFSPHSEHRWAYDTSLSVNQQKSDGTSAQYSAQTTNNDNKLCFIWCRCFLILCCFFLFLWHSEIRTFSW